MKESQKVTGREGFAKLSRNPLSTLSPNEKAAEIRQNALKAGGEPISLWELMLWAYQREMVRFSAGDLAKSVHAAQSSMAWAMAALLEGRRSGGEHNHDFAPCAHEDALLVHVETLRLVEAAPPGERWAAFELLVRNAERGTLPCWDPDLEGAFKMVGVFKPNGKPHMITDQDRHAIACLIVQEGVSEEEKQVIRTKARAAYAKWWAMMAEISLAIHRHPTGLTRWRLNGIGAPRLPWGRPSQPGGLTSPAKT